MNLWTSCPSYCYFYHHREKKLGCPINRQIVQKMCDALKKFVWTALAVNFSSSREWYINGRGSWFNHFKVVEHFLRNQNFNFFWSSYSRGSLLDEQGSILLVKFQCTYSKPFYLKIKKKMCWCTCLSFVL